MIGKATRREIHQKNLLHRSTHILVFNSKKQIFVQKRSESKVENPGLWDISSAGHVDSGETYEKCAHRELWEELQIKGVLTPLTKIGACVETYQENIQVYICQTDEKIKINKEEISEGKYLDFVFLGKEVQRKPDQFTSSLKLILKNYSEEIKGTQNIL